MGFWSSIRGAAVDRDRGGASGGGTSRRLDIIRSRRSSACGPADKQTLHRPWMQSGGRRGQTGGLRGGGCGEQAHQSQVTSDTAGDSQQRTFLEPPRLTESLTVAASSLQTLGHLWGRSWRQRPSSSQPGLMGNVPTRAAQADTHFHSAEDFLSSTPLIDEIPLCHRWLTVTSLLWSVCVCVCVCIPFCFLSAVVSHSSDKRRLKPSV